MEGPAGVPRRLGARLVDRLVFVGIYTALRRVRGLGWVRPADTTALDRVAWEMILATCYVGSIGLCGRTVGQVVFGVELVGLHTGERPNWRAAGRRRCAQLPAVALSLVAIHRAESWRADMEALRPELQQIHDEHAGDRRAQSAALQDFYATHDVFPAPLDSIAIAAAWGFLALWGALHPPSLLDRASDTMLVRSSRPAGRAGA